MKALFIEDEKLSDPTVQRNSKSLLTQVGYGINDRLNVSLLICLLYTSDAADD